MLDSIPDAVLSVDGTWRIAFANGSAERLLGHPRARLLGRSLWELLPPPLGAELYQQVLREPDQPGTSVEAFHEPSSRWYLVRSFRAAPGWTVLLQETTDRHQATQAMRTSDARFRALIERATIGLVLGDSTGRLHYVNDAVLSMLGYTRAEIDPSQGGTPLRWDQLTPPEYLPLDARALASVLRGERAEPYEKVYIARDGRRIPILVGLSLIERRSNEVFDVVAFVLDMRARTAERDRLSAAERLARRRAEGLAELGAALSHAATFEDVSRAVVEEGARSVGAHAGAISLLSPDESTFVLVGGPGISADVRSTWQHYPNAGALPAAVAHRTHQPVYSPTREAYVQRAPGFDAVAEALRIEAEATLPLLLGEEPRARMLGVVSFLFDAPRDFGADEDAFLRAVADRCAQAIERARLLEDERTARRALAERTAQLQAALQHPAVTLTTCDRDLRYLSVTTSVQGPTDGSAIGRTLDSVFDPALPGTRELEAMKRRVIADGQPQRGLLPLMMRGALRWLEVLAQPMLDEAGVVSGVATVSIDVTEREATAEALRVSQERYALAARATSNAIREVMPASGTLLWNEGLAVVFGYAAGSVPQTVRWWEEAVHPEDRPRVVDGLRAALAPGAAASDWSDEYRFRRADGSWAVVIDRGVLSRDVSGSVTRMIAAMEDVTAQRQLESRLRHAQKMEAVGQLAGGVAHDFNNLLTIISGNLELLQDDLVPMLSPLHPAQEALGEISHAAERARTLVRQLLQFSRKQPVRSQRLDLRDVVRGTEKLLRRLIGEEITLTMITEDQPAWVRADSGQLEQVLMNLAVNARDAMLAPQHGQTGGLLEIVVDVVHAPDEVDAPSAGAWIRLQVRDTGHGMDEVTMAHVFEPFFTTKEVGSGTGLGLATVFGIVRQAAGTVQVASEPGAGATFTILLPSAELDDANVEPPEGPLPLPVGRSTVLLVEDETALRAAARRILERRGYRVLEARHGADALALWKAHRANIDAVISDVRMPEMGGVELIAALRRDRPRLPVVLMSGYAAQDVAAVRSPNQTFVEKPFTAEALLRALSSVTSTVAT